MSLKSNTAFNLTKRERLGLFGFIVLICIFFGWSFLLRTQQNLIVKPSEIALNKKWDSLQKLLPQEATAENETLSGTLFYFDPNRLDSQGFIRLGLSPKTTRYLLNWRNKGKKFYEKKDLKPLYSLSEEQYNRLAPFISIDTANLARKKWNSPFPPKEPIPEHINLNTTDSAMLVRLPGIGTVLAHKIIERRRVLGGFLKHEQLLEIYRFPDSTYQYFKEKLIINPIEITKIKLNTCGEEQLAQHPYIGASLAKNILLLRKGLNKYENIGQLRQVPLMNEEKYRKIAPYCTID